MSAPAEKVVVKQLEPMAGEGDHIECWSGEFEFCPVCNPITCSGFLHQRLRFGRWKRRWFKLYGRGTMMIYDKESSSTPVSSIDIKNTCCGVNVGLRPGKFPSWVPFSCTFELSLHNKKLFFYASSVADALQWVKALRQTSDSFKAGRKEMGGLDRRLAILGESWGDDIPTPPPIPAILPVMTDNLATESSATVVTDQGVPSTAQETHRTASFRLPKSFSRDRNSSNRKRREALWHILKKQDVESQLAEKVVHEDPDLGSVRGQQVKAFGSHGEDNPTPVVMGCDTAQSHSKHKPVLDIFTGIKASPLRRSKTSKCGSSDACLKGSDGSTKQEEGGAPRRRAIKIRRPVSAQPQLESLPERESPIGASKTSLNEDTDGKLDVSSQMQSMETFTSLNFSADHEPPPFRSQSCADSIHRIRDVSTPELSTPRPILQTGRTPLPNGIPCLHHDPVPPRNPNERPASRNVTFSELITTYSLIEEPEREETSTAARDDERRNWWDDPRCAPLEHAPTRQGAVMRKQGGTPGGYRKKHPSMDSEISEVSRGEQLLLTGVYHLSNLLYLWLILQLYAFRAKAMLS